MLKPQLPLLVWILAIQVFSSDAFSSGETSRVIVPVLRAVFPNMQPPQIDFWHTVLRKCSHGTEYFILALFTYRAIRVDEPRLERMMLRAGAFLLCIALMDEFHQMFTVSRGPSLVDVGYDCFGGTVALALMTARKTWDGSA